MFPDYKMIPVKELALFITMGFLLTVCKRNDTNSGTLPFDPVPTATAITPNLLQEASGIADSKINAGALWVEEDGGHPPQMQLVQHNGTLLKKIYIKNAVNRDWEDMALAPGPDATLQYIYIADIGDNNAQYSSCTIYRFPEPSATADTVYAADKISFKYPDGPRDAEAILIEKNTKDIYIITKRDTACRVYKLAYPQSINSIIEAELVTTLPFTNIVSAAWSNDGKEIIIKTYSNLYYWHQQQSESLKTTLQKTPVVLGYKREPQGEAICFKNDDSGFFTLSERIFSNPVFLYFYKRS